MNPSETPAAYCAMKTWFIPPIVIPVAILIAIVIDAVLRSHS